MNSLRKTITIKEADKWGAIVLFNTLDYINSCENLLSDTTNEKNVQPRKHKEFTSESKTIISNLHGTCAMFLKNTLPDQAKPAVFHRIPLIQKLSELMKTVMEC